ncbi:DUF4253 domain-containing protein [Salininema proteolyticum]|uniref:DUF4253 domain-containing protein n=1 Tax=Salininema proteolyticum TaxID=1607685 RepID=A0ABV8TUL4_9ACTN
MGLLQRLLGRRDTPDSVPAETGSSDGSDGDTPEDGHRPEQDASQPDARLPRQSAALDDSAPAASAAEDETAEEPEAPIEEIEEEESAPDGEGAEEPPPGVIPFPVAQATAPDVPADPSLDEPIVAASVKQSPGRKASEPATPPEEELDADDGEMDDTGAMFTPPRPSRDLLTLTPPPPPPDEQRGEIPNPESPRPALAEAGVSVGRLQKLATLPATTLWAAPVSASEALTTWLSVRQAAERTGWMPVLLGSAEDWRDGGESIIHEGDEELGRAESIDPAIVLQHKSAEAGEPARGVPILQRRNDTDFDTPTRSGLLGLVRAEHSWQIPALVSWKGSTNWELYGAEHAAILKHWDEKYDIDVIAMTFDVIELFVSHPPETDSEALEAAHEAYAYCPDLLDSGVPTVQDLAEHMIRSRAWYFRWT